MLINVLNIGWEDESGEVAGDSDENIDESIK
jgi:hypothetical protein